MSEELKPCPFCEGNAGVTCDGPESAEYYYGECRKCQAIGEASESWHEAVAAWNTRPIEDALRDRIDALEWLREVEGYDLWREHPLCTWCGISKSREGEIFGDAVDEYEAVLAAASEAVES